MPARVFVAIELPDTTRALLADATRAVLAGDRSWCGEKPVGAHLLHVTLLFLGPVPDDALPETLRSLSSAAARTPAFDLCLSGARAVPGTRRASMVWATLEGSLAEASSLGQELRTAVGLGPETRPFSPHVTLVRARAPRRIDPAAIGTAARLLSDPDKESVRNVSVRSVTVFSSTLGSIGPTYEPLARLDLDVEGGTAAAR